MPGEIKVIFDIIRTWNPVMVCAILAILLWGIYKYLPKHIEHKRTEYESIFTELRSITVQLTQINLHMGMQDKRLKELYINEIKESIAEIRTNYNSDVNIKPTQAEVDKLWDMWNVVEHDLGDGYQEVKKSLENVQKLAY